MLLKSLNLNIDLLDIKNILLYASEIPKSKYRSP